jgi:hypothetical protein
VDGGNDTTRGVVTLESRSNGLGNLARA